MQKKIFKICVFPGDGIGPEVMREALKVLRVISECSGATFDIREGLVGGAAYERCGEPLPEESLNLALESDAVLLGAVGGPKWDGLDYRYRPERALLGLREKLGLFANLRPVVAFEDLLDASPLKRDLVAGIDIMIVRELTGDLYFGKPRGVRIENGLRVGVNTLVYTETEIERIARVAFDLARSRRKTLVSVDKANVLESTQLWRDVVTETGREYPDVTLTHMYVDNCAMQLIRYPAQFDVIVTTNMFGDILSDEASRADPRLGSGYCRPGHRQPRGDDPVRCHDARSVLRDGARSGPCRGRRAACAQAGVPDKGYFFRGNPAARNGGHGRSDRHQY